MKTKYITILALLISMAMFSQKKSRGDRFFESGDYLNAITEYQKELENKNYSKHVFENLATSYYNTFQFRKAYRYLRTLTKGKFVDGDKNYDNIHNFRMYQVLSALGEYDKALEFLTLYNKNAGQAGINKNKAIETIEAFKLKDDDYKVKTATFNSEASEFGVVKIDSSVYFTSDRGPVSLLGKNYRWTHRPFLDIYSVKVDDKNNPVAEAVALESPVNSKLHEGNFCFSPDRKTMYISKSNTEKKKKVFDSIKNNAVHLYKSVKDSLGNWTELEKLPFNNVNYSVMHPALNADGSKLYFSSNMPGGQGDFDIYSVSIDEEGNYGIPQNLGKTVNTPNREQFPFISPEGNVFFSSNGHLGLGMMDIFVSELKDNVYGTPINLGAPINSGFDDFSFAYYDENNGFFASNRNKANDDIYTFEQIGEIYPREYNSIFEVKDAATEDLITNANVILKGSDDETVYESQVTSGSFEKAVFPGKYNLVASAGGYKDQNKLFLVKEKNNEKYTIFLTKIPEPVAQTKEVPVKPEEQTGEQLLEALIADKEGPQVVEKEGKLFFNLPPIYFDYDKWTIRADSKKVLDQFAEKLDKYKSVYIKISSHTDSRGSDSYNQLLSEKRAESTRNYLALVGYVNARRMKFEGFGESKPIVKCKDNVCTEEEHQTNRRSEFEIVKY